MLENIITIRNRDIHEANQAFADFMKKTEDCFNAKSLENPKLYKNCSPSELEVITEGMLKMIAPSTPFLSSDIKLVSGHAFPDILATDYYGVEVKSTNKDKWTSTGSSIVESTRPDLVERIYMLFGCLGSNPPSFKCRLYQDCLSNIAVTHSPRYLIDMNLKDSANIFSLMDVDYDSFRILPEKQKIEAVRRYYSKKARLEHKVEMPWWMNESSSVNISIFSDQDFETKQELICRAFIYFPNIYDSDSSFGYKQFALWLCNRHSLIIHNVRDVFSAGGQLKSVNGKILKTPYPNVVKRILNYRSRIEEILSNIDEDTLSDIEEFWNPSYKSSDYYSSWITMVEDRFLMNQNLRWIPIRELLESKAIPE